MHRVDKGIYYETVEYHGDIFQPAYYNMADIFAVLEVAIPSPLHFWTLNLCLTI